MEKTAYKIVSRFHFATFVRADNLEELNARLEHVHNARIEDIPRMQFEGELDDIYERKTGYQKVSSHYEKINWI